MNGGPTVFVVDDDPSFLDSIRWLLESMKLSVKSYGSAEEFLADYEPAQPGCLVLDVRMPGLSGLQLQEMMERRGIRMPVIVVTGHGDVSIAVRAMKAGAFDFLEKPFNDEVLLERVHDALAVDARLRLEASHRDVIARRMAMLTQREQQVLNAVVSGRVNKQIAAELGISVKTVEIHRGHVMRKMCAGSVAELTTLFVVGGNGQHGDLRKASEG